MKLIGGKLFGRSRRLNGTSRKRNETLLTAEVLMDLKQSEVAMKLIAICSSTTKP
ncbi:MAG: hypothetical protein ACTS7I_00550 [Candidatus Hodgkinia cicadicola]